MIFDLDCNLEFGPALLTKEAPKTKCDHCHKPITLERAFDTMVTYAKRNKLYRLCEKCEKEMTNEETMEILAERNSRWGETNY